MISLKGGERSSRLTHKGVSATRWKTQLLTLAVAGAGLTAMVNSNYAAVLQKANNTTNLNTAGSWVQNVVPGTGDTLVWDSTVTGANSVALGGAMSVTGLAIQNPGGAVNITDANTLTLGTGGIDMSLASQSLSLNLPIALGAAQSWTVGNGRTLNVTGAIATTGGTLTVRGESNSTISGAISGPNGLDKEGAGTLTLNTASTYTGGTTVGGGLLVLNGSNLVSSASVLTLGGGTLQVAGGNSQTFASTTLNLGVSNLDATGGTINLGTITRNAGGAVRFTPGSTYTTAFNFNAGTWASYGLTDMAANDGNGNIVGGDSIPGFWTVGTPSPSAQRFNTVPGGNLDLGTAAGRFRSNTENPTLNRLRFNSPTGGSESRDGNTAPVFTVRNTNRVTFRSIEVTPNVGATDVFITDDAPINNSGPRIDGNNDMSLFQNNTAGMLVFNVGLDNSGSTNGALIKAGRGIVLLNGSSSYDVNTVVGEGTLELGNGRALGDNSGAVTTIGGGNLLSLMDYQYTTTGDQNGTARNMVVTGGGGAIASVTGTSFGVAGTVSGTGGIVIGTGASDGVDNPGVTAVHHVTVNGNGTVVFAGANTYTGTTDVRYGTFQVSNTTGSGTGTGNVLVESGAILDGSGTIAGNVRVNTGGFIAAGDAVSLNVFTAAPYIGTLTIGGKLTLASGAVINYEPGDTISAHGFNIADSVAKMNIFTPGITNPFPSGGSYTVLTNVGATAAQMNALLAKFNVSGIQNPEPVSAGYSYTFSVSGTNLNLTIVSPVIVSRWIGTDGSWIVSEPGNWGAVLTSPARPGDTVPHKALDTANFDGSGSTTVAVNDAISVGTINFSNASYNITNGTGSLTLDNVGVAAQINDLSQNQTISANVTLNSGARLNVVNAASILTISGNLNGAASAANGNVVQSLTKAGDGTAILSGTNTLLNTFILKGTLQVGDGGTTGNIGTGVISDNGLLRFKRSDVVTVGQAIGGTGSVEQAGTGTLVLSAANSYTGGTVISAGTVQMGNTSALGTGGLNLVGASQLDIHGLAVTLGGLTGSGFITSSTANNTTLTISTGANSTFAGSIAETAGHLALVKIGGGELNLTNVNTFSGTTFINAGSIALNSTGMPSGTTLPGLIQTSGSGQVHVTNGLVVNNNINLTGGAIDGVNFSNGTSTASSATLSGAITATGTSVYQMGIANDFGVLTLTGASTAVGNVANLSEGTLIFTGSGSSLHVTSGTNPGGAIQLGTGSSVNVTVANGASLTTTATTGDGLIMGVGGAGFQIVGGTYMPNTLTIAGGTVDIGSSTFNIQGSTFDSNIDGFSNSVVNLNTGGVLRVGTIRQSVFSQFGNTQGILFNFNGGTLVAGASGAIFGPTLQDLIVKAGPGGAIVSVDNDTIINATLGHGIDTTGSDGGFTKTGLGTLTLTAESSYTGGTVVSQGDLVLAQTSFNNPLGLASGTLNVAGGAELDLGNHSFSVGGLLGSGAIKQDGNSTVTLTINSNSSNSFAGGVSNGNGTVNLVKTGSGTQTFSGSNQYGSLTISQGAVSVAGSGVLDSGTIIVNSVNGLQLADGANIAAIGGIFTNVTGEFEDVTSGNATISGQVTRQSGTYVVGISGSGSLTLSNSQNLGGATSATINRGNILLGGLGNLFASGATLTVGSTSSTAAVSFTAQNNSNINVASLVLGSTAAQNLIGLTVRDNANLTASSVNLNGGAGTNAAGVVTVNLLGGTLTTGGFTKTSVAANQGVNLNLNGGTIAANQDNASFLGALTGLTTTIGTGGAKFNDNGHAITIAAPITAVANDGGLTKSGSGTLSLTGNTTYTGTTTINAGSLVYGGGTHSIGKVAGSGTLAVNAGVNVTSNGISASTVNISGHVQVRSNDNTAAGILAGTSKVASLTITPGTGGGQLDITNNRLIVSAPAGSHTALVNTLVGYANSGRAAGNVGIYSTTLPTNTVVAVADNADLHKTSFGGMTGLTDDNILIAAAHIGDANMDGSVNDSDLNLLLSHFGSSSLAWSAGNFDASGTVNDSDLNLLLSNFGFSGGPANLLPAVTASPALISPAAAPVPEPASLAVLALGGVALLRRRRR